MTDFSNFSSLFARSFTSLAKNILAKSRKPKAQTQKISSSGGSLARIINVNTGQNVSGRRILSGNGGKSSRFSSSKRQLMADLAGLLQQAAKRNL